ncbi:MAG: hypothetical protein R2834_03350 [Rhodothermales bacterium]
MTYDLLLVNALATWFMFGVIAVIQIVHYPLFNRVGAEGFETYEREHAHRITWIVLLPMLIELGTSVAMVWQPPLEITRGFAWIGLALVGIIWASTAFLQVPMHTRLEAGFSDDAYRALVRTNWLRTAAWSIRAGMLAAALTVR